MVVAIGADKKIKPRFIEAVAARTGARVFLPKKDLKLAEKRALVRNGYRNKHELDAIAAALVAQKAIEPTLKKVDRFLEHKGRKDLFEAVAVRAIKTATPFAKILEQLEEPEEKLKKPKRKKETRQEKKGNQTDFLVGENKRLIQKVKRLLINVRNLQDVVDEKAFLKAGTIIGHKDRKVSFLQKELQKKINENNSTIQELMRCKNYLLQNEKYVIARKYKDFGKDVEPEGGVIFIENPNNFSEKVVGKIDQDTTIILCSQKPSQKIRELLDTTFIDIHKVRFHDENDFIVVSKIDMQRELENIESLDLVIKEYKKKRKG